MTDLSLEEERNDENGHFVAGINDFLTALPGRTLKRLYDHPSNCLAIFRLLPAYARHVVLVSLWTDSALDLTQLHVLFRKAEGRRHLENALATLSQLQLVQLDGEAVELDSSFKAQFRRALTGGGDHQSFGVPAAQDDASVDIAFLDKYANDQWETILHYMVGSNMPLKPSQNVLILLKRAGLMTSDNPRAAARGNITSKGFQFLLEDVNRQLWDLLLQYLKMAEDQEMDLVEVLGLLFMLGSLELGQPYSTENLSNIQLQVLTDLSDYGLIYRKESNPGHFYPTRLATTLTSSAPSLVSSTQAKEEKGFLIVETNYRIYAYTSNSLQIAILNLFLSLKARFPNLVIGSLTRESIKAALKNGITADQIVTFLSTHAHPQMRKQDPLLPPTVTDQIRLWEMEKNRIVDTAGFLYDDFRAAADFKLVKDYAEQMGVIIWLADPKLPPPTCWRMFVTEDGHPVIRDFIKRRMAAPQQ